MMLFVTLSTVLISCLIGMTKSYRVMRSTNDLIDSAHVSMERMTREIRGATSIDLTTSVFGTDPGVLKLNTTDSLGVSKTVEFDMTGGALEMVDSSYGTPTDLTGESVAVTSLIFRKITPAHGSAVKVEMTLHSLRSPIDRSISLTDTVELRGSY
ncbi:MAG: hypothetical protein WCG55_02670 [bacterium]